MIAPVHRAADEPAIMYESSPSPVTSRQQHEAELRKMNLARASAFNLVNPHAFDAQTKGEFLTFNTNILLKSAQNNKRPFY